MKNENKLRQGLLKITKFRRFDTDRYSTFLLDGQSDVISWVGQLGFLSKR